MRTALRIIAPALLFATLLSAMLVTGCEAHVRVYDPYYHDYHSWNDHEVVYYGQWERDTHRDHVDFQKRSDSEKKEYFDWRHNHK